MTKIDRIRLGGVYGLAALALALAGCSLRPGSPAAGTAIPALGDAHVPAARGSQDLYIGNILGGVLLYSTGKKPHEVGDITADLPRVTSIWVDQTGVLYAFTDNRSQPYETIEEFQPGGSTPFFSLVLQHYGALVAADSAQNVYAQGINGQGQEVIDVYPPGSQSFANEYVIPTIGRQSGTEGMAFDSSGALLVGIVELAHNRQGQIGAVLRLDSESSTFVNLELRKAYGGLIATDGTGNLYVAGGDIVSVYAPGASIPSRIVHAKDTIFALVAASDGTLYVDTRTGIEVYPPGKASPQRSFAPAAQVGGLALGPG